MSMTLPIPISSAPASNSPSSEESNSPCIPPSPIMSKPEQSAQALPMAQSPQQQDQPNTNNATAVTTGTNISTNNLTTNAKRKPSRRANTAERRATHNAVERQRRETLNGRFLDLAALLPNLSQVRRPSKSSIVNSSIAHIHASRRHRLFAARELRSLKLESDTLRREVNDWRNRTGMPIIEEPVRSEAFSMVISGELEVITGIQAEEEDDEMAFGGFDGEDDGYPIAQGSTISNAGLEGLADTRGAMLKNFSPGAPTQQAHHNSGNGVHLTHVLSHPSPQTTTPMVASPTAVAFENPALPAMYEGQPYQGVPFLHSQQSATLQSLEAQKIAAWNAAQFYANSRMIQQRAMFTSPPGSSHGSTSGSVSPGPHTSSSPQISTVPQFNDAEFFTIARSQQQIIGQQPYVSPPERDDASSVGSNQSYGDHEQPFRQKTSIVPAVSSVRERSRSLSSHAYDLEASPQAEYPINLHARRMTQGGVWPRDDITMGGLNLGMGMGVVGMNPITVGGGGNANGFAMMMM